MKIGKNDLQIKPKLARDTTNISAREPYETRVTNRIENTRIPNDLSTQQILKDRAIKLSVRCREERKLSDR